LNDSKQFCAVEASVILSSLFRSLMFALMFLAADSTYYVLHVLPTNCATSPLGGPRCSCVSRFQPLVWVSRRYDALPGLSRTVCRPLVKLSATLA
jgi:hypothetical protein